MYIKVIQDSENALFGLLPVKTVLLHETTSSLKFIDIFTLSKYTVDARGVPKIVRSVTYYY